MDTTYFTPADARRIDQEALRRLFLDARTQNGWLPEDVPDDLLREAVEIAKMGPTSANNSPLRIVFVRSPEAKAKLLEAVAPGNLQKTSEAPVTAILAYDEKFYDLLPKLFPHADARSWFAGNAAFAHENARRNATLQAAYLILALRALGLDAGPMTGFDAAKVDAAFFPEGTVKSDILVNIGHGDPAKLFPRLPRLDFDEIARFA